MNREDYTPDKTFVLEMDKSRELLAYDAQFCNMTPKEQEAKIYDYTIERLTDKREKEIERYRESLRGKKGYNERMVRRAIERRFK